MKKDFVSGVYIIINLINKKVYVGSSINIEKRFYNHKYKLNNNTHSNNFLQNAWNKYKEENFSFIILEKVDIRIQNTIEENKKILLDLEQYYLDFYKSFIPSNGYNLCIKAHNTYGCTHTDETKAKISKILTGKTRSDEIKQKISDMVSGDKNPFYNKKHTDETKKMLSELRSGTVMQEDVKEKISNTLKGRIITEEHKEKLRIFNTGKKMSEESKKKMSKVHKGKIISEEQKQLSSLQNRGSNNSNSKLTEDDVIKIKTIFKNKSDTMINICKRFSISMTQLKRIKSGKCWSHIKID